MTPAGFWKRLAAIIIDSFIISMLMTPIITYLYPQLPLILQDYNEAIAYGHQQIIMGVANQLNGILRTLLPISLAIHVLYFSLQESSRYQATVGKRILGIKVVNREGKRLSLWQAITRSLAKLISGFIFGLGYLMAAFTQHKQALHDLLTNCYVVDNKSSPHANNISTSEPSDNGTFVG